MERYNVFVIMPFGEKPDDPNNEWWKLYWGGIKPLEEEKKALNLNIYRADHTLRDLGLKENIKRCIEDANILVCVLTDNPNVLWEVGYAEALEKPIVFMIDEKRLIEKEIPVLAGQPNFCRYNHNLVREAPPNPDSCINTLKVIRNDLAPYIREAAKHVSHRQIGKDIYRVTAYKNRRVANLAGLISSATHRVDILVTNLDWFVNSESFNLEDIENHPFKKAINNGARIRILSMDPETVIAEYRAKQLGESADVPGYRNILRESIKKVYKSFKNFEKFKLRIYNELPLQISFIIDDKIITGIIARGERSRELVHIEFYRNFDGVTESFLNHFDGLFNASMDVSHFKWAVSEIETVKPK